MASVHYMEPTNSHADESAMSAVLAHSAPTTTNHITTENNNSGMPTTLTPGPPPPVVTMNGSVGPLEGSKSIILNSSTTTTTTATAKTTTLGPLPPQPHVPQQVQPPRILVKVYDCTSEFNKNSNNDNPESSDSSIDVFDTKQCGDGIPPTRIEAVEESVLPASVPLPGVHTSQGQTQDDVAVQVACLDDEIQSSYSPPPENITPDPIPPGHDNSDNADSQDRFQSGSSPVLNMESYSDIILFNPNPSEAPSIVDKSCESNSELLVGQNISEDDPDVNFYQCISGVQINNGLSEPQKSNNPTSPSCHDHITIPSPVDRVPTEEAFPLNNIEGKSSQIQSRQSILVPNTANVTSVVAHSETGAFVQPIIPETNLAQSNQWASRVNHQTQVIISSENSHSIPCHQGQTLQDPKALPANIDPEIIVLSVSQTTVPEQEPRPHMIVTQSSQGHVLKSPTAYQYPPGSQFQQPNPSGQFYASGQHHSNPSQFSPNSRNPQFFPPLQTHPYPRQMLRSSQPEIAYRPQISPNAHPHSQISSTAGHHQPPQLSPNVHHPQVSPTGQRHPHSQFHSHLSQFSPNSSSYPLPVPSAPSHSHPNSAQYPANVHSRNVFYPPNPNDPRQPSALLRQQIPGPLRSPISQARSSMNRPSCQLQEYGQHSPGLSHQFSPNKISTSFPGDPGGEYHTGPPDSIHLSGPPKCFTTDAQLQSQYQFYNQTHPITVKVGQGLGSPPGSTYQIAPEVQSGPGFSKPTHHQLVNCQPQGNSLLSRSDHVVPGKPSVPIGQTHARSHPHAPHPYDLQARQVRPNLQHSPTTTNPIMPLDSQYYPQWVGQGHGSLARTMGPGPVRGIPHQDISQVHGQTNKYYPSEFLQRPNLRNPHGHQSHTFIRPSKSSQPVRGYPPERYSHSSSCSSGMPNSMGQSISSASRGTVRPIAHQSATYAQYSSQYGQYRPENNSSNIYYQGGAQGLSQSGSGNPTGTYPIVCRVSPIRNRLEHDHRSSPPYHPYLKLSPDSSHPSSEYNVGQRTGQGLEYRNSLYGHEAYNERLRRQTTQFTLQALPGLQPGAQGGHHLLVKTESGQFQLLRFGMPSQALNATTGTPHPPSSPLTMTPNSLTPTPPSPLATTATTNALPQSVPVTTIPPMTFATTSPSPAAPTTILGGVIQSQVVGSQAPPLPGPVNFMSTSCPRPPVVVSSSSTNSTNTTISNSSIPSQALATGSPTTTATTYRLQTVPSVPPTAASNSSGLGMTASMSMQQQMLHSQVPPSQAPSVLTSANSSSTATTATTVSQMTPDTAKTKCKNFLSFLLELSAKQNQTVARNVKTLIQGLVDGKVNAEDFSDRLQKEVNSQPQPCLVGFLKKSLPPLRHSLATKELTIDGIRAPILSSLSSGMPTAPVTALIPQNQVRPSPVPTTPVRIITPINSSPSQQQANINSPLIPRSTAAAVQQRFATPSKSSPTSKASKASSNNSSPTTQSHSTPKAGPSKSAGKEKGKEKSFASSTGYSADDDINDVAAMGGVNLAEESQRILGSTEMIGTQIRSCKDEALLPVVPLQSRIKAIAAKHGLDEPSSEVAAMISHALEERLKTILEKLSVVAEHRLDVIKLEDKYDVSQDVKGQLRFLEELDKLERKRHDEQEREMLIRAAKSRSKSEDPEQAKLKAKAKEMQRVALEEMRQREANLTALQAIGPRKKPKLDTASGSQSTTSQMPQSNLGASNSLNRPQMAMRPRLKRVSLRDLMFLMEHEKETTRSHFLYKHLLLK